MIREITTFDELEKLANKSAPAWEGLELEGLEEQLKEIDPKVVAVYCNGSTYNDAYNLTGNNRYPDDLHIVFLDEFSLPIMQWKFNFGCRWADDVRDNNIWREESKNESLLVEAGYSRDELKAVRNAQSDKWEIYDNSGNLIANGLRNKAEAQREITWIISHPEEGRLDVEDDFYEVPCDIKLIYNLNNAGRNRRKMTHEDIEHDIIVETDFDSEYDLIKKLKEIAEFNLDNTNIDIDKLLGQAKTIEDKIAVLIDNFLSEVDDGSVYVDYLNVNGRVFVDYSGYDFDPMNASEKEIKDSWHEWLDHENDYFKDTLKKVGIDYNE